VANAEAIKKFQLLNKPDKIIPLKGKFGGGLFCLTLLKINIHPKKIPTL
jgi:hypothetical protein